MWKLHRVQFFTAQTERKNQKQKNPRNKRKKKETAGILRQVKKMGTAEKRCPLGKQIVRESYPTAAMRPSWLETQSPP